MNSNSYKVCFLLLALLIVPSFSQIATAEDSSKADKHVQAYMKKFNAPGLNLAMAKNGKIIFAKGYGMANTEKEVPMAVEHRLRIASVSKPLTSIGIHLLIEAGKLSLNDKVFGPNSVLGSDFPTREDAFENQLTIQHLLEHQAGKEWSNKGKDPMFQQNDLSHSELIRWVLKERPLPDAPGQDYNYSNFGYCLLGRIIEKKSGLSYPDYMQTKVFKPAGATSFVLAQNGKNLHENEANYYSENENAPFRFNAHRMDSHGGWVATPTDIVKVFLHADGKPSPNDLLSAESIQRMTTPSKRNARYAQGWSVNHVNNWWHGGSLPGEGAIAVRTHDGYCWAAIVNTRNRKVEGFHQNLDQLLWKVRHALESNTED